MAWQVHRAAPCIRRLTLRVSFFCCALAAALSACDERPAHGSEAIEREQDARDAASEHFDARAEPATSETGDDALSSRPPFATGMALEASASAAANSVAHDAGVSDAGDAGPVADGALDDTPAQVERSRDFAVGTRRIEIANDAGRVVPVQLWYPAVDEAAAEAEAGHAIEEFEPPGARRELLKTLIQDAREDCPNLTMHAALDATPYPRSAPAPLLVYSHHFNGSRFSMFSIAEALAREGMVVAAPDHVNGSVFERQDVLTDALNQFNSEFLETRIADLQRLLDVLLEPQAEVVPAGLCGRLDAQRVGAIGHSLGAITVGVFSVRDTRVRASLYLAMVPSPSLLGFLYGLPEPKQFRTPALYLTAQEDSTVAGLGGAEELAANYEGQPPPAFWIEVRDTGHFSFADDCGLVPEFDEGCGPSQRVTNGESFTYVDAGRAREIAARYSAAFFLEAPAARLTEPQPPELVTVKQREGTASP